MGLEAIRYDGKHALVVGGATKRSAMSGFTLKWPTIAIDGLPLDELTWLFATLPRLEAVDARSWRSDVHRMRKAPVQKRR